MDQEIDVSVLMNIWERLPREERKKLLDTAIEIIARRALPQSLSVEPVHQGSFCPKDC